MSNKSSYCPATWTDSNALSEIYLQPQTSTNSLGDVYYFDCYFSGDILSELRKTSHPVQTGANISDHAYLIPITINLDIGMSDCGISFNDSWDGSSTKSVNAYTILQNFQQDRTFVNMYCKYGTFKNLLVSKVNAHLDKKTIYGLRATVTLEQTYLATVTTQTVSARSATTSTTSQGGSSTTSVSTSVTNNNKETTTTPSNSSKSSYTSTNSSTQSSDISAVTVNENDIYSA